jgi:hypothetical protein
MVQLQHINTGKSAIVLDEERIIRVTPAEGAEIDLEEVKRCFDIYRELGFAGRKGLQLMDGRGHFSVTTEARDYAAKYGKDFFHASAVVSSSLPIRIVVNFFNSFYKNLVPFRMFGSEAEALAWLRKFMPPQG